MIDALIRDMQARIEAACTSHQPIHISGSGSRHFLLPAIQGEPLTTADLQGIVEYEPTELVVTVRTGTRLSDLQKTLSGAGQMLGFEPPAFGETATVGGTVACGLSGPRRPFAGSLRDFVLGVRCLNGRGEDLRFGGQVMKNVAGYDVARLMVGAQGTLGVLLEVSFKVLPLPEREQTYCRQLPAQAAIQSMNELAGRPLPLSGAAWTDGMLYIRFSGAAAAVEAAGKASGLEYVGENQDFWRKLREQQLDFFQGNVPLWRLSLPATADQPAIDGDWIIDWGGAQRWLRTQASAEAVHDRARAAGGYATLYRGTGQENAMPPLPDPLLKLQQQLKQAFDPAAILNPGLLYTTTPC